MTTGVPPGFVPYTDRPVRVGILGLGRVYDLTITGYRDNDDAEVVALCDTDPGKLEGRGPEWRDAARYDDIDAFLAHDMDLVEVLVPTPLHRDVVCRALDAGFHVNVQKPMARSLEDADAMLSAAARNGRVLRVMENFLFYEPLQRLKQLVDDGELGEPAGFHMKMIATGNGGWDVPWESYQWQFEQALDGTGILMFDDGWHKFSVARWLFGPVTEVMAWVGRTEIVEGMIVIDAPSTVMWRHASGVQGTWDVTFAPDMLMRSRYYSNDERFDVVCRRGWARVNQCTARGLHVPSLEVYADGIVRGHHDLDDDWASAFREQTRHLLRVLRTGDGDLLWSGDQARDVLAFNLAALESSRRNAPVHLAELG
jgi:predicted dehydrogenase